MNRLSIKEFVEKRIRPEQVHRYLDGGRDFIDDDAIRAALARRDEPDRARLRDILDRSLAVETLGIEETAALLRARDPEAVAEMEDAAARVKRKVYDNRIVVFAPLYLGTRCVNDCLYCGFRRGNAAMKRGVLSRERLIREVEELAGRIGHKRLIVVYGEHPETDTGYIAETLETIYAVRAAAPGGGEGRIRRANVNAAPLPVEDLERLRETGIGTYQVFQETYDREVYRRVHPAGTIKHDFAWRLTCMHRALDAGVDDVGIGALFGLADWRFETLGLVAHARELETRFGVGPHTISFPRLEPAQNSALPLSERKETADADFRRLVTVLRLAVPHAGMILTAREPARIRRELIPLGITQIDAQSRIGLGAYSERPDVEEEDRQQFHLNDGRTLEEVIRELADAGIITSFCTAGYRCGRTGKRIMDLLRSGKEGRFCKLNAILTFREWLLDFAGGETRRAGEALIERETEEVRRRMPEYLGPLLEYDGRIRDGERDLYF
ncbi:MAG: [FeFe] hydrogenase H-cluster radical SAM maturase HydG [Candidatus Eisenbacteria bacterium]|nr:[FeFe] hydrogenase H-cluster radical SAM maturase HydG [Candidatus Eisenbacteria bacterium]